MVRFKNRYMTIEIIPNANPDSPLELKKGQFNEAVLSSIQEMHGDFGYAAVKTGFISKYCNEITKIAILRARHGPHKLVTSTLPFVKKIGKSKVKLKLLHQGATMKHSFLFIRKFQRQYLDRTWVKMKTDEERKRLEIAVMDFTKTDVQLNLEKIN